MPIVDNTTLRRLLNRKSEIPSGVESVCVDKLDYDLEENTLTVQFHERGTYEYYHVPLPVYVDFSQASSQGRYFNLYIRDNYSYTRIA